MSAAVHSHAQPVVSASAERMAALLRAVDEAADRAERSLLPSHLEGSLAALSPGARGARAWARYFRGAKSHLEALWQGVVTDDDRRAVLDLAAWFVSAGGAPRDGGFFDYKTPGQILDEIDDTNTALLTLGRDINRAFCVPFRAHLAQRVAEFERKNGRPSNNEEGRTILRQMGVATPEAPTTALCYHSPFVSAWSSFLIEWTNFYLDKQSWLSRQWYGVYEKTVAYKKAALDWRAQFEKRGGVPSSPPPQIPKTASDGVLPSFGKVMLFLGAIAAIVIVPPLLRSAGGK